MAKAIFLDRDGVLNQDREDYVYRLQDFIILPQVCESLQQLKQAGYLLIIITNQSGIAKGLYTRQEVIACYSYLQEQCGGLIDAQYYSPYHPNYTASLSRKPNSLMLERAIAKFDIQPAQSWLVGDSERDILAGQALQIPCIKVGKKEQGNTKALCWLPNLAEATAYILQQNTVV